MNCPEVHPLASAKPVPVTAGAATSRSGDILLDSNEAIKPFECDALSMHRQTPLLVALPENVEQVKQSCRSAMLDVPVVTRGAGTGLSGGALPHEQGCCWSDPPEPDSRHRSSQPDGPVATRRPQPRHQRSRCTTRPVLRARPFFPDRLQHRRQRGRKLRRRALPEIWPDRAQRAGSTLLTIEGEELVLGSAALDARAMTCWR